MRSSNQRMEEWGTKPVRRIPTLVDLCVQKAIDNVRYIGNVGVTDPHLLERILPHCTAEQLMHIEDSTEDRDLSPVTDKLWKNFYSLQFGSKSTSVVVERMKEKKVSFKWRQLYEAKLKDVEEAQQKSFERIKQLYKKEDARMGLFERMKLSAKEDVTEHTEPLAEGAQSILEATASFVVQPGEIVSDLLQKRKANYGATSSKKCAKTTKERKGLGAPGLKPSSPAPATAGKTLAAAGRSSAAAAGKARAAAGSSSGGSSGGSFTSGSYSGSDGSAEEDELNPLDKFVPDWDLTNNTLLDTPELYREFLFSVRPPAEVSKFEDCRKRQLSDSSCSAVVNGLLSFVEIHNRWLESNREVRELKKQTLLLQNDNTSLKSRCELVEKEKELLAQNLSGVQENLFIQSAALKRVNVELKDYKDSSSRRISELEDLVSSLESEKKWIISDGIELAFNKVRDSNEFLDMLAEINSLSDKVGYNAGLVDGVRLAAEGKTPEDAKNFGKDALAELRARSKLFDETSFPMSQTIAAFATSELSDLKAFLSPPSGTR